MSVFRRLLVVFAMALLAASCSSTDTLATVNDREITKDDLFALRESYSGEATLGSEEVRSDLSILIVMEALTDAAEDQYGYVLTEDAIEERLTNPPARYARQIVPADQFPDFTEQAVRVSAVHSLIRDAVAPYLAKEDVGGWAELLNQRPEEVTRSCVRRINTASEEEALAVMARLEAGEDFATVAAEMSLNQANPGGLITNPEGECLVWLTRAGVDLSRLAATAPLNTPVGPVVSDDEWNVIVVEDRETPADADALAGDPMEWLDPDFISAVYTPWLNDAVRGSDIDVSPTVGRWSDAGIGIAPPGE